MKSTLLIGLGNPLAGDDGIGWHVAEQLLNDPRMPDDIEVLRGGTDLLRHAKRMTGRTQVVLVDALLDRAEMGTVQSFDNAMPDLDGEQEHIHHLSPVQAVRLLREVVPVLKATRFRLITISINSSSLGCQLSPTLASRVPQILQRILCELSHPRTPKGTRMFWQCEGTSVIVADGPTPSRVDEKVWD
ncbi:MAG: hydrogenase maturation protease [Candidatus Krumholzibacteria bacterium]|nr:hydrogenase maturation protease [Candidatus Krumholzibacteria bacterium]